MASVCAISAVWWVRCLSAILSRDQLTESCSIRTCFLHETCIVSKASVSLLYSLPIFWGTFFPSCVFRWWCWWRRTPYWWMWWMWLLEKCYRVMDLLCEQCMKQQDMNEVLSMNMHYISCVLQKCLVFLQERDDNLDALLKRWHHHYGPSIFFCPSLLKGRDGDGFPQYQEKLICDCIRKFPYCEATLLQQLVRSIAPVEIVSTFLNM